MKLHQHLYRLKAHKIAVLVSVGSFTAQLGAKSPSPQIYSHGFLPSLQSFEIDNTAHEGIFRSLSLTAPTGGNKADTQTILMEVLRSKRLDSMVSLKRSSSPEFNLFRERSVFTDAYHFAVDDIEICLHEIKTHETLAGRHLIFGSIPEIVLDSYDSSSWPDIDESLELIREALTEDNPWVELKTSKKSACLWVNEDKTLSPVWDISARIGDSSYRIFADDQKIFDTTKLAFHVDGTASIFPSNPLDLQRESFVLTGLKGNGTLENSYFKIEVDTNSGNTTALAADNKFVFDISSPEFTQTSLFTNANRMLTWLKQNGFDKFGGNQIILKAHRIFQPGSFEDKNNATYEPSGSNGKPTISVGDGDGEVLKNLGLDADVVNHELGHHVIYQSVNYLSGESLVIHEAIADFFVFARTRDSCLGESICPETSGACAIHASCLRTADNTLRLDSQNLPSQAHIRSQFFSGFLWDLYEKDNIPIDDLVKMVIDGIALLVSNSGYQHVLFSLLMIDDSDFDGKYCSLILNRARERGMESLMSDVACESFSSVIDDFEDSDKTDLNAQIVADSFNPSTETSTHSSSSSRSWCGSIGATSGSSGPFSLIIYLMAPFLLYVRRRLIP